MPSPLVLAGFMGCGKTTVGRLLGQRLGWHFCDLDDRIEATAGCGIAAIFAQRGEPAYRELEHRELRHALGEAGRRPTVLALGGGTFVQPQNLEPLRQAGGCTVFLEVPLEELLLRVAGMANRPLFRDEASFRALYAQRVPYYRQAQVTVAASLAPAQVAERVMEAVTRVMAG
ncbi:MAG: shikimate kinase [Terriglobales bacterium]